MYVCICNAVTDRQIHQAVAEGVRSMRELQLRLGLASTCGRCAPCARELLMTYLHEAERDAGAAPVVASAS